MKKLLVVGLAMTAACAGRDLSIFCEVATEAQRMPDLAERHMWMAKQLDDRLSMFGDMRKVVAALAHADARSKRELLQRAAAEMGHPDWKCAAADAMFAPPPLIRVTSDAIEVDGMLALQLPLGTGEVEDIDGGKVITRLYERLEEAAEHRKRRAKHDPSESFDGSGVAQLDGKVSPEVRELVEQTARRAGFTKLVVRVSRR